MVRVWRGASCAAAGTAAKKRARKKSVHATPTAGSLPRKRGRGPRHRSFLTGSIIDRDPPRHAADGDRDDRLATRGVDDRDVVAKTVGDVEGLLVAREREAPGALADEDVGQHLAARDVDHRHMGGVAERHIGGPAVAG